MPRVNKEKGLRPVAGARVRLLRDVISRRNVTFRAGLVMRIVSTDREYLLRVRVRAKEHYIRLPKKDYQRTFVVVSVPDGDVE